MNPSLVCLPTSKGIFPPLLLSAFCVAVQVYNLYFIFYSTGRPAPLFPPEHPDWAPTLKLGHNKVTVCVDAASRHERAVERQSKKQRYEVAETLLLLHKQLPCVTEVPGTINSGTRQFFNLQTQKAHQVNIYNYLAT